MDRMPDSIIVIDVMCVALFIEMYVYVYVCIYIYMYVQYNHENSYIYCSLIV